ncbi:hydrogenase maturation nickel metallochaperone HypA [Sulfurimonas diazotrophicus]|uniref:Hydrogenase maturation factor HypA n=1 Tax=Sulfurimonas diazotrophicus TaxID=3131939 RepID=A0ABZ3HBJ1_9BACT
MHEYSVVQALLEQVEKHAAEHEAERVTKVIVKIGVMSGVEPHLLEIAFNTFKERTVCDGADFVMDIQPVTLTCRQCGSRSELEKVWYRCPACESLEVDVVDGEEMYLMSLEME